jgi:predicted transcriptional regulator
MSRADHLSRRERQIMDAVHALGRATAAEVRERIPDPPGYSSVRKLMTVLEAKGHLAHELDGQTYVYSAIEKRESAGRSALDRLLTTFFGNSAEEAVAALLDMRADELTPEELERMSAMLNDARRKERK